MRANLTIASSWGRFDCCFVDDKLTELQLPYLEQRPKSPFTLSFMESSPLHHYIHDYMMGAVVTPIEFQFEGTSFQQLVWTKFLKMKAGETICYADLAAGIGHPRSFRAVAQACAKNPLPLVIPCHRVVGKSSLGGYAYGLFWKQFLLALEK